MTQDQVQALAGECHRPKLDTARAAEYLGLGKSTLDKFRLTGGGPVYIQIGKRVTYDPKDLDAWAASHKRTRTSASIAA
jgi:predicted DNA-binding transcriptional regulator AlpA